MKKPCNLLKTKEKKIVPPEQKEQELVVQWLKIQHRDVLFCASAGGMRTNMRTAIKMKRAGYVAGFPDLFIYEPRGSYHGLAIELKRSSGGTVSPEQKAWIDGLLSCGYSAYVCKGAHEAIARITEYLAASR